MNTFQRHKQQVLQLFKEAISLTQNRNDHETAKRLESSAQHLEEGKLIVVIAGEFKQGKSSLINALINEPELFPVDVDITTNLVSTITYGQQEKISVLLRGQQTIQTIQRNEIADYVTEQRNRNNERQARLLVMETPNPELKEGLVLVDTPGVGGLNVEHTEVAYAYIPNVDVVLFVSDAFAPLSNQELDFVKMVARHCQNLIFIVAKADAVQDYWSIVESNREKLSQVLECSPASLSIIPVSSRAKLAYLKSQDSEDLEDSNFAALEQQLWQLLNQQRGQILLMRALGELGRGLAELKLPLQTEWETYQQHTQAELDRLEQQFEEARSRLQALLNNSAAWRTQLSDGLTDVRAGVMELFQTGFAQVRMQAEAYIADNCLIEHPEQIAGLIEVDIDALITQLGGQLSRQAATLHAQIEAATGLNLHHYEIGSLHWEKENCQSVAQLKRSGWWEKTLNVTRSSMFNGTAGSTLGGLVGGVVGAGIGLLFGGIGAGPGAYIGSGIGAAIAGVSGLATGARQGLRQVREQDQAMARREINKIIKPYIDQAQRSCNVALNDTLKQLERSMRDELTTQMKRTQDVYDRSLKSIQQSRKLSQEQAALKAAELKVPLQQINQLQKTAEDLVKAVLVQSAPAASTKPVATAMVATASKPTEASSNDYGDWADD